jgi:hypothetical protein
VENTVPLSCNVENSVPWRSQIEKFRSLKDAKWKTQFADGRKVVNSVSCSPKIQFLDGRKVENSFPGGRKVENSVPCPTPSGKFISLPAAKWKIQFPGGRKQENSVP